MEIPTITASSYVSSTSSADQLLMGHARGLGQFIGGAGIAVQQAIGQQNWQEKLNPQPQIKEASMSTARIVKVFIADSNENLPLEKRVLYTGEEKLTDLTDQELFFDVPISELLTKHNEYRKTVVDKKQAEKFGRDIFLEPARIRDLKMVVVNVAQF